MDFAPTKEQRLDNQLRFANAEKKGREKALTIFNDFNLVESEDIYSIWDFSGSSITRFFLEVKNREILSTEYSTTILEYDKLKALTRIAKENNGKAYYFTIYNDNKAFLFDLFKIKIADVEIQIKEMNHKTSSGYNRKIDKLVYLLPLELAVKKYTY